MRKLIIAAIGLVAVATTVLATQKIRVVDVDSTTNSPLVSDIPLVTNAPAASTNVTATLETLTQIPTNLARNVLAGIGVASNITVLCVTAPNTTGTVLLTAIPTNFTTVAAVTNISGATIVTNVTGSGTISAGGFMGDTNQVNQVVKALRALYNLLNQ